MGFVYSFISVVVVLIALVKNAVHATFLFRPVNSTCVWTERQLRKVIEKASNKTRTRITLCREKILISNTTSSKNTTGIDLTDRYLDLKCKFQPSEKKCILDGQGSSRIFFGDRTDFIMRNVHIMNSKPNDCSNGGAVVAASSNLKFTGCSFDNNGNYCPTNDLFGGALSVYNTTLTISGGTSKRPVIFSDNTGNHGGVVFAFGSKVSMDGYVMMNNNNAIEGGAVEFTESTVNIKNVKFIDNLAEGSIANIQSSTNMTMKNVEFNDNSAESILSITKSLLQATNCTFTHLKNDGLSVDNSKVTLNNSTFTKMNTSDLGFNIYIYDDDDPLLDGTFVKCESKVVFCNGINKFDSIYEPSFDDEDDAFSSGNFINTDCRTKGVSGTPGQGTCPS